MLTDTTLKQFHRRMEHLAQEFEALTNNDVAQPLDLRLGHTVVLAVRPWSFGVFDEYLRNSEDAGAR